MASGISKLLEEQPLMKVVAALFRSSRPRHLREIAAACGLSPAGAADIVRRLNEAGGLNKYRMGNRTLYSLELDEQEAKLLGEFFAHRESVRLQERALQFSERARTRFAWMDEAYHFFKQVKGRV